jgi:MFS family permease
MAMTSYLLKSTIVGALGGLLFGFDTAVIAGTTQQLTVVYHLTPFTLGLTVFIGLVGTVIGAMTAGVLGQRIGGREALRIMAILYTVSALGCALAWNWPALMVFGRYPACLSLQLPHLPAEPGRAAVALATRGRGSSLSAFSDHAVRNPPQLTLVGH